MWMRGILFGNPVKESMKLRSWAAAEREKRELETTHNETKIEPATIQKAKEVFLSKLRGDGVQPDTIRKYNLMFSQLEAFCGGPIRYLHDLTFEQLLSFRESWTESAATQNKKLDRLKAFFSSSHDAGMITRNPAKHIKPAKAPRIKVKPFSAAEQNLILAKPQTSRISAFVHTLYHSGLRISDCCFLKPQDFDANNLIRVNRKNQAEVFVPIPPTLKADLDKIPLTGGYYFLIGASENLTTQTDAWRTILNDLYKTVVADFHPHRFRHTRVVEWLAHGLTMEEVAGMVGTSVKVLEKHYASFAPARRTVVSEKLAALWKPKLQRVK